MFTGIVSDIGTVRRLERRGDLRARIGCDPEAAVPAIGASIACDGICLTVVDSGPGWFDVDVSAETVARTTADRWAEGRRLNLERALRIGDELGGHIVTGHVDGVAIVDAVAEVGDSLRLTLTAPRSLARYIAQKGSVALDGTSLTVNSVEGTRFTVNLIPHTRAVTTWADVREGDVKNLEIDTLARYVARLAEADATIPMPVPQPEPA